MTNRLLDQWTSNPAVSRTRYAARSRPPERLERQEAGNWKDALEHAMGRRPLTTLLVGFAIGAMLGWYIKR
jgi:hypothetical protein